MPPRQGFLIFIGRVHEIFFGHKQSLCELGMANASPLERYGPAKIMNFYFQSSLTCSNDIRSKSRHTLRSKVTFV